MKNVYYAILSLFTAVTAGYGQTDTISVDFGDQASSNITAPPWNNLTDARKGSLTNLMDSKGVATLVSIAVTDSFNGINTAGVSNDPELPGTVTKDSFFGSMLPAVLGNEVTGGVTFTGLDVNVTYNFGMYASRGTGSDNREAKYIVDGATKDSTTLDPMGADPNTVWVNGIKPKSDGSIVVTATAGPNNNNSAGYYYIGAIQMTYTPIPAASDTIDIDLGDAPTISAAPWNNITDYEAGSVTNLTTTSGLTSSISVAVTDSFNLINTAGVTNNASLPGTATGDSFFGSMLPGVGGNQTTGGFTFSGLDPNTTYHFGFYGSRVASDNRETKYIAEGMNSDSAYLNVAVSNPGPEMVWVYNVMPKSDGTIKITATAGPNNNNSVGYYYIGAIRMAFNGNIGLNESAVNNLVIYPNPARHEININTGDGSLARNIDIMNVNGSVVKSVTANEARNTINISGIASGFYWVRVQTDNGTAVSKIIIE
ncbi:MAG TPA: hypothetical protein DCG19_07635 [Cryomorphaceae bacterium]|nr:hypothetical protein [Owenweeksia sp.]MBG00209.1 hypothetical protein [Owenweeksia sp.]HAD97264.1 hypothetical protein [Cryomorphaceae bacterium]HBF20118.1 hypothetical protein [Cryomorphaceae bacterium]|tara:strand:+ start:8275 stop:9723 length:1449 start_codon:yes stop_codon:yes gene_type:complete